MCVELKRFIFSSCELQKEEFLRLPEFHSLKRDVPWTGELLNRFHAGFALISAESNAIELRNGVESSPCTCVRKEWDVIHVFLMSAEFMQSGHVRTPQRRSWGFIMIVLVREWNCAWARHQDRIKLATAAQLCRPIDIIILSIKAECGWGPCFDSFSKTFRFPAHRRDVGARIVRRGWEGDDRVVQSRTILCSLPCTS